MNTIRKKGLNLICLLLFAIFILPGTVMAATATENVLHSFSGYPKDGANPWAGLLMDGHGNLYGTTYGGGANNAGTIFKLEAGNMLTVLHNFSGADGANPSGGLIMDSAGNLYGTTTNGGSNNDGAVFKLDTSNKLTVLHSFSGADGQWPYGAGVIMDGAGNLYGNTTYGGANNVGTIFKLDTGNTFTVLHSFSGADGTYPHGGLIMDRAGNLYGTTGYGGNGYGTVFKLDTGNTFTVLHSFSGADGATPQAGLIMDGAGNLYGTTAAGGAYNSNGTVFKLDAANTLTVLHSFDGTDGSNPFAPVAMDGAGNLYGTCQHGGPSGYGTAFKLDTNNSLAWLYTFSGGNDGGEPFAGMILDSKGNLYGTTYFGGPKTLGTVFQIKQK